MEIILNGQEVIVGEGTTVTDLLFSRGLILDSVVVQLNLEVLSRERWPETVLRAADRVELIKFVGGG